MKKIYLLFFVHFIPFSILSGQDLQEVWAKSIGWYTQETSTDVAIDSDGNLWGIGYANGSIDTLVNMGQEDVYLFKADSDGNIVWQTTLGGVYKDRGYNLTIDAHNNCWISGYFYDTLFFSNTSMTSVGESDAFLIKYSSNGNLLWFNNLGGNGFEVGRNLVSKGAYIYWSGTFQDTIIVGQDTLKEATSTDVFLIKLDTSGNYIWAQQWGCPSYEDIAGMSIDSQGRITISSLFRDAIFINNDTTWGNTTSNIFIAQFESSGNLNWTYSLGGTSSSLCHDEDGNIYLNGSFQNTININGQQLSPWAEFDGFVVSLDSNGQFRWLQELVGPDQIITTDVLWNNARQELYVSGILQGNIYYGSDSLEKSFSGPRHVDDDMFVIAFDKAGTALNSQKFGGTDGDWVSRLVLDTSSGSIYMYGTFQVTTDIGAITLNAYGGSEIFIAKFNIQTVSINELDNLPLTSIKLYPQPIHTQATLSLMIEESMDLNIRVIDSYGRLVQTIWNGPLTTGEQRWTLQADNYPSNQLYFIHLQSKNRQQTYKFTIFN